MFFSANYRCSGPTCWQTAYNLEGGRAAAERVAQRLESVLLGFQDHGDVAEFYSDPRNSNFFDPLDDIDV